MSDDGSGKPPQAPWPHVPPPQQPAQHPQHPQHPQHAGYAPPQHGYPQPQYGYGAPQMPPPQQQQYGYGAPQMPPPPARAPAASPGETSMFKRSLGRAFRLRIEPYEVKPSEREALAAAKIHDPYLQAFLAWRRSLLFLVAFALLPLTALRMHDALSDDLPDQLKFIVLVPAGAEALLCLVCWYQLKNWTRWRKQRRALAWAWGIFMIAPFLVFFVPVDALIADFVRDQVGAAAGGTADAWGAEGGDVAANAAAAAGIVTALNVSISIYALLTLAPKAVSLLAGTIRAGLVTKMLFPGTSGPGWIVVLATPLYTLFVFTLLIVPYQITGSGWYAGAMIGLAVAQISIGRAGYSLTKPTTHDEAVKRVAKARGVYLISILAFAGCLLVALGSLAGQLEATTIATTVLSFEANVLILTLSGSDLVVAGLDRARGQSEGARHLVDESHRKLAAFANET